MLPRRKSVSARFQILVCRNPAKNLACLSRQKR